MALTCSTCTHSFLLPLRSYWEWVSLREDQEFHLVRWILTLLPFHIVVLLVQFLCLGYAFSCCE